MSRISRLVVLVTALASLLGLVASTAGAVTWRNDASTSFTATGGQGTLTSAGVGIICSNGDASGNAPADFTGNTYSVPGTILFTGCTIAGSAASIECGYTLTATTLVGSIVTGNADFTCGLYTGVTKLCHIAGVAHAQYTNPHPAPPGTLVVTATSGLTVSGASCPAAGSGTLTQLDFRTTSATPPTITRA